MPKICKKCNNEFPFSIRINGRIRNLNSRKYCLDCSPFGKHNTSKLDADKNNKQCSKCKETKLLKEFYMKTDGRPHCYCKICMNSKRVEYMKKNKSAAIAYKGGKCQCCGYDKLQDALEFHHKNPDEKDFSISTHRGANIEKIKPEIDKCVLLCANCHRETHAGLHTW
jgi:hypothetical protein